MKIEIRNSADEGVRSSQRPARGLWSAATCRRFGAARLVSPGRATSRPMQRHRRVGVFQIQVASALILSGRASTTVKADGIFEFKNVLPVEVKVDHE